MGRYDDRFSRSIQFEKYIDDLGGIIRIEISGRLIADDDRRIMDKRSCDSDTLGFSPRKCVDERIFFM